MTPLSQHILDCCLGLHFNAAHVVSLMTEHCHLRAVKQTTLALEEVTLEEELKIKCCVVITLYNLM